MRANAATKTVTVTEGDTKQVQDVESDIAGTSSTAAVATRSTQALALGEVSGEGADEIKLPWLTIVHGTSKIVAQGFNPGDIVLDKSQLLVTKGNPLEIIILKAATYWKEWVSGEAYKAGVQATVYRTMEEVKANGGTVAWDNTNPDKGVPPSHSLAVTLSLLVRRPKDVICAMFGQDILGDGFDYAPAQIGFDKTAYKDTMPAINSASMFALARNGLPSGVWALSTMHKQRKDGTMGIVPVLKLVGNLTPDALAKVKAMLGRMAAPGVEDTVTGE